MTEALSLLDAAQLWWFKRFLASEHSGGVWIVDFDLYTWAKGMTPYPNLATQTFPA